ncbi:hypothetical protein B0H15DRAFT_803631 [Mycena belliarum]|uniref:Uncharacterized protein n=1 Tax=Mycena belliarum TaxID=1033014 RepID=A0AAD6TY80_9AGAR|nr:hypothetical protein B0H15DRAFT_803631 [Mycena belliae]
MGCVSGDTDTGFWGCEGVWEIWRVLGGGNVKCSIGTINTPTSLERVPKCNNDFDAVESIDTVPQVGALGKESGVKGEEMSRCGLGCTWGGRWADAKDHDQSQCGPWEQGSVKEIITQSGGGRVTGHARASSSWVGKAVEVYLPGGEMKRGVRLGRRLLQIMAWGTGCGPQWTRTKLPAANLQQTQARGIGLKRWISGSGAGGVNPYSTLSNVEHSSDAAGSTITGDNKNMTTFCECWRVVVEMGWDIPLAAGWTEKLLFLAYFRTNFASLLGFTSLLLKEVMVCWTLVASISVKYRAEDRGMSGIPEGPEVPEATGRTGGFTGDHNTTERLGERLPDEPGRERERAKRTGRTGVDTENS